MLPQILLPLYAPLSTLKGVGPHLLKTLQRLNLERLIDLVFHFPIGISYFPRCSSLQNCRNKQPVAIVATILSYDFPRSHKSIPAKIVCDVEGDTLFLIFFKGAF